jgi:acyl-CoA thioesterase I
VFLGTSLTAGLGVPPDLAFPALIQERIDAGGLPFRVINAGVSGDTTAGGLRRIDWLLREPFAVLVLELGANDMLRGQDIAAMRANLQAIIDRTSKADPAARIVIAGMQSAPNLGDAYARPFAETFAELARANGTALIPFLLDGVAGVPDLNQSDGMHPTAAGHRVIAGHVWTALEPVLRELARN